MKRNSLVSILITNHNKEPFLVKNLKSCLKQNYKKKEIIFFDDKSTDQSLKVVKKFKRVKLIKNQKKINKSKPLNQINAIINCYKKSKGKIIFLLDSDDYFNKKKLSIIVKKFIDDDKLEFLQDIPVFSDNNKNYYLRKKIHFFSIWPRFYPTSTIAIKRKFFKKFIEKIDKNKYPNLEIDARLCIYAFLKNKFKIINKKLTFYNSDPQGISSNYSKFSKNWWKKRNEAYQYMFGLMKKFKINIVKGPDYYLTQIINKFINQ